MLNSTQYLHCLPQSLIGQSRPPIALCECMALIPSVIQPAFPAVKTLVRARSPHQAFQCNISRLITNSNISKLYSQVPQSPCSVRTVKHRSTIRNVDVGILTCKRRDISENVRHRYVKCGNYVRNTEKKQSNRAEQEQKYPGTLDV
jgi:hypothetical protein